MVLAESKKTRCWTNGEGEAQAVCVEAKKMGNEREEGRETTLNDSLKKTEDRAKIRGTEEEEEDEEEEEEEEEEEVISLDSLENRPYSFSSLKKTGDRQSERGTEAKKTGNGDKGERETNRRNLTNGGCPFAFFSLKKTGSGDEQTRDTQLEYPETKKTGNGEMKEWETCKKDTDSGLDFAGCPYVCSDLPSVRPPIQLNAPSPRLAEILEGAEIPGDSGHPPDVPDWLDRDLFNEGRKFYRNYIYCLAFSEILSLLLAFSYGHALKVLIHTGRSDSPPKARRRYFSTLFHLMTWFQGDVWDPTSESHRDILSIRITHARLGESFNRSEEYEKVLNASVEGKGYSRPSNPLLPTLKKDFRDAAAKERRIEKDVKEVLVEEERTKGQGRRTENHEEKEKKVTGIATSAQKKEKEGTKNSTTTTTNTTNTTNTNATNSGSNFEPFPLFISQLDMSLTQSAFMGLILTHPEKLGAAGASTRELEGLVHFWRGLGWLLGIEDRFNFCAGSLEETRELCLEVERDILLPGIIEATNDYEHMSDALISGMADVLPVLSFPAMLRYLGYTLDIPTPGLARSLTWRQFLQYWVMRIVFGLIYYIPSYLKRLNFWFLRLIAKVKENDKVNLAAYRKGQAPLTVPVSGIGVRSGSARNGDVRNGRVC